MISKFIDILEKIETSLNGFMLGIGIGMVATGSIKGWLIIAPSVLLSLVLIRRYVRGRMNG